MIMKPAKFMAIMLNDNKEIKSYSLDRKRISLLPFSACTGSTQDSLSSLEMTIVVEFLLKSLRSQIYFLLASKSEGSFPHAPG